MFTQCSKCETVFRLSAEALRAAGGQVRCGRCGEVFNALTRLAENAGAFTKGQSSFDMESRAEEILEATGEFEAEEFDSYEQAASEAEESIGAQRSVDAEESIDLDLPPDTEVAHLQIIDPISNELLDETSLEFSLPPEYLDRVFVADKLPEPAPPPAPPPISGLEVAENVREEMLQSYEYAQLPEINLPSRRVPIGVWLGVAVVLAALLVLQIVRNEGGRVATHAPLFGSPPTPSLAAYQLRQWGVSGDPAAKGTLRVRASIMNTSAQLQPYPLLRVTLANRFGTRVGAREFEPAEYLGAPAARLLAPNERIDATLDIVDPGKDAEGFEIDVCVRDAGRKVSCTSDAVTR